MTTTNKEIDKDDEMNLNVLRYLTISFLRGFFRFLSFCSFVISRRTFLVLAGLFMGLFLALAYYFFAQTKYYQATFMVASTRLTNRGYAGIINQLNVLAKSGSTDRLANDLHLSPANAGNILFFEARNLMDEELDKDTSTRLTGTFMILFGIRNVLAADTVEHALVDYINGLPYLKALCAVEQINNEEKIKYIGADLGRLDSLKLIYNKFLASSKISATVYNDAIDPSKLFSQSALLLTDLQEARRKLYAESTAIQLIDPIKIANTTRSKSLPELLVILGLGGAFMAFLVGLMLETRNKLLP
jgi:hypothetical protein